MAWFPIQLIRLSWMLTGVITVWWSTRSNLMRSTNPEHPDIIICGINPASLCNCICGSIKVAPVKSSLTIVTSPFQHRSIYPYCIRE